ncbi:MAG: hypothetical protein FJW23_11980 [Acidimicrobiia bacterium]|nr:hypothetical protein [Acidimicrobiia bacterium]
MTRPGAKRLVIVVGALCLVALTTVVAIKRSSLAGYGQAQQGTLFFGFRDVVLGISGTPVTSPITDWSFFDDIPFVQIETRPWWLVPYTVTVAATHLEGRIYLYAGYKAPLPGKPDLRETFPEVRAWNGNLLRDPRIRVRVGDRLFTGTAEHVDAPPGVTPELSFEGTSEYERVRKAFGDKFPGIRTNQEGPPEQRDKMHFFRVTPNYP